MCSSSLFVSLIHKSTFQNELPTERLQNMLLSKRQAAPQHLEGHNSEEKYVKLANKTHNKGAKDQRKTNPAEETKTWA